MQQHIRRLLLAAGITAAALVAALTPPPAAAQNGTLDGETFLAGLVTEQASGGAPPPSVCDPNGDSTVYFSATGTADGPYPGTFTETGTVTLGPQNLTPPLPQVAAGTRLVGPVPTFEARFEIHSGTTTITGTKTLSAVLQGDPFSSTASCASFEDSPDLSTLLDPSYYATISGRAYFTQAASTYQATIDDGATASTDSGEALTYFNEAYLTGGTCQPIVADCAIANTSAGNAFTENFFSTADPPPPPPSGTCKVTYGGWITAQNGDRAWFAGLGRSESPAEAAGKQLYRDSGPAGNAWFVSKETTSIVCAGDSAQIYGRGSVDGGTLVAYRIDLTDAGRDDTYRIVWAGGTPYDSGAQPLRGGNVTIH